MHRGDLPYTLWKASPHLDVNLKIHHIMYLFLVLVRTFKFSFSKFQLSSTLLSTVVTVFYRVCPTLFILQLKSFHPFFQPLSISPAFPSTGNHFPALPLWVCFFGGGILPLLSFVSWPCYCDVFQVSARWCLLDPSPVQVFGIPCVLQLILYNEIGLLHWPWVSKMMVLRP